ncbi:PEP-CTERM sorting domain-containing protein [bacterium]|nr:PEP-CTERM sorting domain-containing protein [bacterium]
MTASVTRAGLTPSGSSPSFYNVAPLVIYSPVPEPSTFVLSTLGLLGLGIAAWRKNYRVA